MRIQRFVLFLFLTALIFIAVASPVGAATQAEINNAISTGVVWLASNQNADGSWGHSYPTAETGLVVLKLEDYAIEQGMSPFDANYVYKPQVEKGLQYLFDHVNADGSINVEGYSWVYTTSIGLMAISESGAPSKIVTSANPNSNGKTYKEVAQGAVNWLLAAQHAQGGFGYRMDDLSWEDQSNAGWATLGLVYAQKLGISDAAALPGVSNWVTVIQGPSGGSSYTPNSGDYWVNVYKTGSLLYQFKMVGRDSSDPDVQRALDYIAATWDDPSQDPGWYGTPWDAGANYQATFGLMKGFQAQGITTFGPSSINWYDEFADRIVDTQLADGSWPDDYWTSGSGRYLSTSWALLTLERTAELPPAAFGVVKSADTASVSLGGSVTYTYLVSNTGLVSISNIVLTDDKLGTISGPSGGDTTNPGILDPFETWTYTSTTNLFATTTNTATATGLNEAGAEVSSASNGVTVTVTGGNEVPEFPTLVLPAAMMLGMVFVVYSLRITRRD